MATLAAGLGGVSLTLRHGNRRFELEQRDRWHAGQRQAVAELLHVGHEWALAANVMLMRIAITANEEAIADSSEQRKYRTKREEFGRALVTARLVVTEPGPNGPVRALSTLYADMPMAFRKAMRSSCDKHRRADEVAVDLGRIMIDEAEEHLRGDRDRCPGALLSTGGSTGRPTVPPVAT
ncbi:hypothetical protein [Lentzea sp. E54]|uniref:hypothetical protein n=1 Tax=Lentzea xerophila TaxID=3435883 RepID=UPI003DA3A72E